MKIDFAVVVPMANESADFEPFISSLKRTLDKLQGGNIYFIIDNVSKDNTLELCNELALSDPRFHTVWAPENRNVVDAYLRGYSEALRNGHHYILEMDAGLSHDPSVLPVFLEALQGGYDCAFGSRFIKGGNIIDSSWKRTFLSRGGTLLSNVLLGTKMHDMTSGYQGFTADTVRKFLNYRLLSKAHFYQTELRYLLREKSYLEIPIQYRAPSPSVNQKVVFDSIGVLMHYFLLRLRLKAQSI
jgi:dolichol-phosphate mannosyltransferase